MRLLPLALLVTLGAATAAHETWILPTTFAVKPGEKVHFHVTSGMEFPSSGSAIQRARVAKAGWRLGATTGTLTEFQEGEKALGVARTFTRAGAATVWVELKARDLTLTDDQVPEYLDEIGATATVRDAWQAQKGRAPWSETYTKYAKTVVAVGDPAPDQSWQLPVGMALELVPVSSPFTARAGQGFTVQLLSAGQPLSNWSVGLQLQGQTKRRFETTDAAGRATFQLASPGEAMFFVVQLRPDGRDGHWRSSFTTLTLLAR